MLKSLTRRAHRAGLENRILTRLASKDSLNIDEFTGQVDFVLAFAVVHEIPDQESLFYQIHQAMKKDATLLIAEPTGHVKPDAFEKMLEITKRLGFQKVSTPTIRGSISVVLRKP
jgi:SAM-dependent methyltransferase